LYWIHQLPEPRDSATALRYLAQTPAGQRLCLFTYRDPEIADIYQFLETISERGSFEKQDLDDFRSLAPQKKHGISVTRQACSVVVTPDRSGEQYLQALECYQEVFSLKRTPHSACLESSPGKGTGLASRQQVTELVEELSQGCASPLLLR
jgi:hypothetical protein